MLDEFKKSNKVIGIRQSLKALEAGKAQKVFIAADAEKEVISPLEKLCLEKNIQHQYVDSKEELGSACGIRVGAAVVTLVK
jgi:large subunit ribosomal protein L7A